MLRGRNGGIADYWRIGALCLGLTVAACAGKPKPVAQQPQTASKPKPAVQKPASKPAWVMRKVVPDAVEIGAGSITVSAGDNMARVASRAGVSVGALAAENGLTQSSTLQPGQVLKVPAGRYHRVKSGETGITIARAYGIKWSTVVTLNQLTPPYTLAAGQVLRLPSTQAVAAMTLEERARAFTLDIDDLITGSEPAPAASRATAAKTSAKAKTQTANTKPVRKPLPQPATFSGRWAWPVEGRILSSFGPKPGGRYNDGINIKANTGTPVRAAADGVVAYVGDALEGFGGLVLLKHAEGWVTAYAHNEELLVARGQTVKRGDIVARAGSTGSVDEPQLHFEIRRGRTPVDPTKHLPARGSSALN